MGSTPTRSGMTSARPRRYHRRLIAALVAGVGDETAGVRFVPFDALDPISTPVDTIIDALNEASPAGLTWRPAGLSVVRDELRVRFTVTT